MQNKRIFIFYAFILMLLAIFLSQYTTSYLQLFVLIMAVTPIFYIAHKNSTVKETDPGYVKHTIFNILKIFILASFYYVLLRMTTGYSHPVFIFIMLFVIVSLTSIWSQLPLSRNEKKVIIVAVMMSYGLFFFEAWYERPVSSFEFYHQELNQVKDYQTLEKLMTNPKDIGFTEEDFEKLLSYQQAPAMAFRKVDFVEMWDGSLLHLDLYRDPRSNDIRIYHMEWLPEEAAEHFREFPSELVRAPMEESDMENGQFIKAKGHFIREGHHYHRMLWEDELGRVFGTKEVWDSLWDELNDLQAPEGPVIGSGIHPDGYLHIRFREDWEKDLELINEMYEVFKDYAAENDIEALPMLFLYDES
ncbi:hypothetical protein SAMN05192551_1087 [Tindallia magadiensis]|uniref:Uncharacterized protein n=1 Tax=Tindallia magadiensis TaxID=69895 RepID=A0A1I3G524_9FIRM|nr:hypothetical protein [Tindallia magadiensis]SFI18534.1 hypothetical protein SAMN05192551_1087 [Tindallia magadiensis]